MEKAVAEEQKDDIQRWTTKRKAALVLSAPEDPSNIHFTLYSHGIPIRPSKTVVDPG